MVILKYAHASNLPYIFHIKLQFFKILSWNQFTSVFNHYFIKVSRKICISGADPGGGAPGACPPPKIGKNMIFWRKIVIFHTNYPNNFRASLRNWKNMIFWRKIVIFHTKYPKYFRASLRNWKNMIFWRKIVIFHTKYSINFRASLHSAQFF